MGYFAQDIEQVENETPVLIAEKTDFDDLGILTWNDNLHDWISTQGEKLSYYLPTKKDIIKRNKYEKLFTLSG